MVSTLISGLSGTGSPGSSSGLGHCLMCFCARHFTLTVPVSTQVYKWYVGLATFPGGSKWVPPNLVLGEAVQWINIPSREE